MGPQIAAYRKAAATNVEYIIDFGQQGGKRARSAWEEMLDMMFD